MPFEDDHGIDNDAHKIESEQSDRSKVIGILQKLQEEKELTEEDRRTLAEMESLDEEIEERIESAEEMLDSGYTGEDLLKNLKALHQLISEREELEHREEDILQKIEDLEDAIEKQS